VPTSRSGSLSERVRRAEGNLRAGLGLGLGRHHALARALLPDLELHYRVHELTPVVRERRRPNPAVRFQEDSSSSGGSTRTATRPRTSDGCRTAGNCWRRTICRGWEPPVPAGWAGRHRRDRPRVEEGSTTSARPCKSMPADETRHDAGCA
jgi:hypothetical protein